MVTVLREGGFRFVIYKDDHEPAHLHVHGDGEAKIRLIGSEGQPTLIWSVGLSRGDVRRIIRLVAARQDMFMEHWRALHG